MTEANENILSKIGITVGKGNEIELDEEAFKKADIQTLKSVFTGYNSFADKVSMKANSISNAAARTSGTYKKIIILLLYSSNLFFIGVKHLQFSCNIFNTIALHIFQIRF